MSDASPPAAATPAFQSSPVNSKQCAAPGRTACPRRGRPLSPPTPRPRRLRAPRRPQVQPDHDAQGGALCARDGPAVAATPQGTPPARPAAAPRAPAPRRPPSTPVTGPCSASLPLLGGSICTSRATATRSAACAATRAASSTSPGAGAGRRARCEVNACALPCASARGSHAAPARSLTRALPCAPRRRSERRFARRLLVDDDDRGRRLHGRPRRRRHRLARVALAGQLSGGEPALLASSPEADSKCIRLRGQDDVSLCSVMCQSAAAERTEVCF